MLRQRLTYVAVTATEARASVPACALSTTTTTCAPPPPPPESAVASETQGSSEGGVEATASRLVDRPEWHYHSRRTGLLAFKMGQLGLWDSWGERHPLTVLYVPDNYVVASISEAESGYNAVQVGTVEAKAKHLNAMQRGYFSKMNMPLLRHLQEFRVSPDALIEQGTKLSPLHFVPGQLVDVRAKTKGKGFQGVVKRWGFRGNPASHGTSKTHRAAGSTGSGGQDPGRVFKGKKMAGRMGGKFRTTKNLWVFRVDTEDNLLYVKGAVPGPKGGLVRVTDAKPNRFDAPPPFPTLYEEEWPEAGRYEAPAGDEDPFEYRWQIHQEKHQRF